MLRMVLGCAVACGASVPALAGERNVVPPGIKAIPARAVPLRVAPVRSIPAREVPVGKAAPAIVHSRTVNARAVTTFVLPPRNRATYDLGAPSSTAQIVAAGYGRPEAGIASSFALPEPRPLPAWQLTDRSSEITARAGARYAVGDTLADHRRVGPPRSALDAMLVLRIDGRNESPPLSLRGGVAGAMWRAGTPQTLR